MIYFSNINNEDCLEGMKSIQEKYFDYAFTSPPYNRKRNDKYEEYEDIKENYYEFLTVKDAINACTMCDGNPDISFVFD